MGVNLYNFHILVLFADIHLLFSSEHVIITLYFQIDIRGSFSMDALKLISGDSIKKEPPKITVGDTVRVHVRIKEGEKSRIQIFEGTVIAKKHGGVSETFTVRRLSHGCGVERVFPVHSPVVDKVETIRSGKVRRAKLYYLRKRVGKAARVKERIR
jgi:large subunit ribosomal protein L19